MLLVREKEGRKQAQGEYVAFKQLWTEYSKHLKKCTIGLDFRTALCIIT